MKQSLRFAVAAAAMGMAATASAGYFEIGGEIEDFNGNYSNDGFYTPYVTVGGNPIEGSALSLDMKTSKRHMDDKSKRQDSLFRQEITVGYEWNSGNFTFSPSYRLRQNYQGIRREFEHRIAPNMGYRLNDTFSMHLGGFFAPVQKKNQSARGDDTGNDNTYVDYKHEIDLSLRTQLSDAQRLTLSIFNEYGSREAHKENEVSSSGNYQEKHMSEWQFRMAYSHDFGDFALTPFARIGLSRKSEKTNGVKVDESRNRYGISGSYRLTSDLSLVGETYFQSQKRGHVAEGDTEATSDGNRNMMFYKLGLRYSF